MDITAAVGVRGADKVKHSLRSGMVVALVCVGLSAAATVPFFFMAREEPGKPLTLRMPITHDMFLQYEQMRSFHAGLSAGAIYPRWEADTNHGYGAPTTTYYPPGFYYLTSALYPLLGDWVYTLLAAHLVVMIASGAALYLYARRAMSRAAATVAMAAYITLPYHLVDQYQRGALAELMSFVWMPLMLYCGERLFREGRAGRAVPLTGALANVAGLGLVYGAFLWSHPPTAYQFSLAFGVFALLLAWARRDPRGLLMSGAGLGLGLGLAAAYLYPALVEQPLIHHEFIADTWPYHATYVFVHDLPYLREKYDLFFYLIDALWAMGAVAILAGAVCFFAVRPRAWRLPPGLRERLALWLAVGGFVAFLMLEVSQIIGQFIPRIETGVFTWRMLAITTLVLALLAGAGAQAVIAARGHRRRAAVLAVLILVIFITVGGLALSGGAVVGPGWGGEEFEPVEHLNPTMMPAWVAAWPGDLPQTERARLAAGRGNVEVEQWRPEHRALWVELSADDRLLVRTFDFPGWTVTVDGRRAAIRRGEPLGEITLDLPPGVHRVELRYQDTRPRRLGERVTRAAGLLTLAILAAAAIISRRRHSSLDTGGEVSDNARNELRG